MTDFKAMLSGGHPNSLGHTVEVVDAVLADRSRLEALYRCYFSTDEVVRLRVSSGMKRVTTEHPDWTMDFIEGLLPIHRARRGPKTIISSHHQREGPEPPIDDLHEYPARSIRCMHRCASIQ